MTPIEILATILAVLVLLKFLIIFIKPQLMVKIAKSIYEKTGLITIIYLVLATVVAYYIFASLTIVEIAAVMLFTSILVGLGFIPFAKEMIRLIEKESSSRANLLRRNWLSILIWLAIAVWVIYAVFS